MSVWIQPQDRRQFHDDGYMIIRNVVPRCVAERATHEIAAFVGADLSDPCTWYCGAEPLDGLVPLHHAQSLWDIRQCPNLHQMFAEYFGTRELMVDMNRCLFRPPVHPEHPTRSLGGLHWDTDPRADTPESLQAVVLLTDVAEDGGGFQCLPEIYQNLDGWLKLYARRKDFDFFNPELSQWRTTQVEGKAGDVILWSTRLPHGSAVNRSARPRIASFVSMQPNDDEQHRADMKEWWLSKRAPANWRGLPGQLDPEPGAPAELTELGRKLIGVAPW